MISFRGREQCADYVSCEAEQLNVSVNILWEPSKPIQYVAGLHVFLCSQWFSKYISQVHLNETLLLAGTRINENALPSCCPYQFYTLDSTLSTYILAMLCFLHVIVMVFPAHWSSEPVNCHFGTYQSDPRTSRILPLTLVSD